MVQLKRIITPPRLRKSGSKDRKGGTKSNLLDLDDSASEPEIRINSTAKDDASVGTYSSRRSQGSSTSVSRKMLERLIRMEQRLGKMEKCLVTEERDASETDSVKIDDISTARASEDEYEKFPDEIEKNPKASKKYKEEAEQENEKSAEDSDFSHLLDPEVEERVLVLTESVDEMRAELLEFKRVSTLERERLELEVQNAKEALKNFKAAPMKDEAKKSNVEVVNAAGPFSLAVLLADQFDEDGYMKCMLA